MEWVSSGKQVQPGEVIPFALDEDGLVKPTDSAQVRREIKKGNIKLVLR
jgi:hypothetical protein